MRLPRRAIGRLVAERRSPAAAADVAERAGVRRLVLAGLLPGDATLSDAHWVTLAGDAFNGPIRAGRDLLTI